MGGDFQVLYTCQKVFHFIDIDFSGFMLSILSCKSKTTSMSFVYVYNQNVFKIVAYITVFTNSTKTFQTFKEIHSTHRQCK